MPAEPDYSVPMTLSLDTRPSYEDCAENYEDNFGTDAALEPTHSDEDEAFYVESILSGDYDEAEADREGDYEADYEDYDGYQSDHAADLWEQAYWGD